MEIYENFARQVEIGQAKVAEARLKAARLGLELEQSRREKEMAKFASDFSFDPQGFHSDLARAEELINRKSTPTGPWARWPPTCRNRR